LKIESLKITSATANHGFFGRRCGGSEGFYSSLNCSKFVGDDESLVLQNLDIIKKELNAEKLVTLRQMHGNCCIVVDWQTESDIKTDAMVTRAPGIAIGILTADCAPILLLDKKHRTIGAIHAGWRGAASGVIESTIQKMAELGSDPQNIVAAIGPCIAKESYEVDNDFKRNFKGKGDCFFMINSKLHFDLPKYCQNRLRESGLNENNIDVINVDTYADQKNYFSYRFANKNSGGICGRNISAICLGKENGNNSY
jgi:YfiH family protein